MTREELDRNAYDDPEVNLEVTTDRMLMLRDAERDRLVNRFHRLRIRARTYRKEGYRELALRYETEAARTREMIVMLDNPMRALRFMDHSPET